MVAPVEVAVVDVLVPLLLMELLGVVDVLAWELLETVAALVLAVLAAVLAPVVVVPPTAIGRTCSITSTYVGPAAPAPDVEELVLLVSVEEVDVLPVPVVPSMDASSSSTRSTVAPLASMPMKSPACGGVIAEVPAPLTVLLVDAVTVLVCALFASALVAGALKLPVQPPVPSWSV
ncbi:MAG TPA: hypothetical protein VIU62_20810 [Chloroflexota bacterium]